MQVTEGKAKMFYRKGVTQRQEDAEVDGKGFQLKKKVKRSNDL